MYRASFLVAFLWVLAGGTVYSQAISRGADESAIRDLVQKYIDARNSRDAERTRSLFTADADQLVSTGEWRKGIDAVVRGAMASSQKEMAKSSIQVEAIRFVEPSIAIVDGRYETVAAVTSASRKMWTTFVVKRTDHNWRIAAIRNMPPAPTPSGTPH